MLGVSWDTKSDEFVFDFQEIVSLARTTAMTKRKVLKLSASIYDPLGYLCPITARLKTIFQMLGKDKLDWDAKIPNKIKKVWDDAIQAVDKIRSLRLPRYVLFNSFDLIELHGFCDASKNVYCAVIYFRIFMKTGGIRCSYLCSKSKVAPIKPTSIPRLELLGCKLLSKLVKDVRTAVSGRIEIARTCCWSDSKVALYWIKGKEKVWKPWVESRVEKVRNAIPDCEWNHVRGELNPADIPTGSIKDKFDEDVWRNGPKFLSSDCDFYLDEVFDNKTVADALIECKKGLSSSVTTMLASNSFSSNLNDVITCTRIGTLGKLLRVTSLVLRFVNRLMRRAAPTGCVTVRECACAMDL